MPVSFWSGWGTDPPICYNTISSKATHPMTRTSIRIAGGPQHIRSLCAELVDSLHKHTSMWEGHEIDLVARARAALAQPVAEGTGHLTGAPSIDYNSKDNRRRTPQMNLYIINEVLSDYTFGMVVIAADSLDRCREMFIAEFGNDWQPTIDEYDGAIQRGSYKVLAVQDQEEGIVSHVFGGG